MPYLLDNVKFIFYYFSSITSKILSSMIKDVFVLRRNAWYCRLMKYMWKLDSRDFTHMCAFFWLTVFNIVVFPIWFLMKTLIIWPIRWVSQRLSNYFDKQYERWAKSYYEQILVDKQELRFFAEQVDNYGAWTGKWKKFYFEYIFISQYQDWSKIDKDRINLFTNLLILVSEVTESREKRQKANEGAREEISRQRKQRINRLLRVIKPIAIVFIYAIGLLTLSVLGWLGYKFIHWLGTIPYRKWIDFLTFLAFFIVIVFVIVGLIFFMRWVKNTPSKRRSTPEVSFSGIGRGISTAWYFIIQLFKRNCPAIRWKD